MTPGTEFARDFCAGIGPLQLGVVLVLFYFILVGNIHKSLLHICTYAKKISQNNVKKSSMLALDHRSRSTLKISIILVLY